jgi:glutamate synthase domain-containing protein 1
VFLPRNRGERRAIKSIIATILEEEDLKLLGWREVPADNRLLGARAVASQPIFQHLCVGRGKGFPFNPDPEADRLRCES